MSRRGRILILLFVVGPLLGFWLVLNNISLSALETPGSFETYAATKAKRWIVGKSARSPLPPAPPNDSFSLASGRMLFGGRCAQCHGEDGRTATEVGRWMHPRTPDLGSLAVQEWSDAELFWIIKNGVRLTGMPGFGKIHGDDQIWHLVRYVRSLGTQPTE